MIFRYKKWNLNINPFVLIKDFPAIKTARRCILMDQLDVY